MLYFKRNTLNILNKFFLKFSAYTCPVRGEEKKAVSAWINLPGFASRLAQLTWPVAGIQRFLAGMEHFYTVFTAKIAAMLGMENI